MLVRLHELAAAQAELTQHQGLLQKAQAELKALAGPAKQYQK